MDRKNIKLTDICLKCIQNNIYNHTIYKYINILPKNLIISINNNINWELINNNVCDYDFIIYNYDKIDWNTFNISLYDDITINKFIIFDNDFLNKLNWFLISSFQLTTNIIELCNKYLIWGILSKSCYFENNIFFKYFNKINVLLNLQTFKNIYFNNQNLKYNLDIEKIINLLNIYDQYKLCKFIDIPQNLLLKYIINDNLSINFWICILTYQKISENIIDKYAYTFIMSKKRKYIFQIIFKNQNISDKFKDEYMEYLNN